MNALPTYTGSVATARHLLLFFRPLYIVYFQVAGRDDPEAASQLYCWVLECMKQGVGSGVSLGMVQ